MTEQPTTSVEAAEIAEPASLHEVYRAIANQEPRPIHSFVSADAVQQKEAFLAGDIRNPHHSYDRFGKRTVGKNAAEITGLVGSLPQFIDENSIQYIAYKEYGERYAMTHEFIDAATLSRSEDPEIRSAAQKHYMELNIELFGAPEKEVYESLMAETRQKIEDKVLSPEMDVIRAELFTLLPKSESVGSRFIPSDETVAGMQRAAEYLYGGMLTHIPEGQDTFSPEQVADVFRAIVSEEFGEAAQDWRVVVARGTSITVSAGEKLIKIPENRKPIRYDELRGLVAHEIGVHMLRAITGSDTDLPILTTGLSGYYDSEEGLGKVMEQALKGEYKDSGIPYYEIAGLMYFENKDFRDVHEIMWRITALNSENKDEESVSELIARSQDSAYKSISRISRGTDDMPWFKDLAYYNGAIKMWKYASTAFDDPEKFMLLLMGKGDITNPVHRRVVMEAHTP